MNVEKMHNYLRTLRFIRDKNIWKLEILKKEEMNLSNCKKCHLKYIEKNQLKKRLISSCKSKNFCSSKIP